MRWIKKKLLEVGYKSKRKKNNLPHRSYYLSIPLPWKYSMAGIRTGVIYEKTNGNFTDKDVIGEFGWGTCCERLFIICVCERGHIHAILLLLYYMTELQRLTRKSAFKIIMGLKNTSIPNKLEVCVHLRMEVKAALFLKYSITLVTRALYRRPSLILHFVYIFHTVHEKVGPEMFCKIRKNLVGGSDHGTERGGSFRLLEQYPKYIVTEFCRGVE